MFESRQAHALAALTAAELRTGVRQARTSNRPVLLVSQHIPSHTSAGEPQIPQDGSHQDGAVDVGATQVPGETLTFGVSRPRRTEGHAVTSEDAAEGAADERGNRVFQQVPSVPELDPHTRLLPVQPALAPLLSGLPVGGVLSVQGSTSLLLSLLSAASAAGAWLAFVGTPELGLLAASDAGVALERVAVVPGPGVDAPLVVAALLDGMDIVVLGPGVVLLEADRRRLAARARERGTVLATTTPWPGAHVNVELRAGWWHGVDDGAGWLRHREVRVRRTGRGAAARPIELDIEVPVAPLLHHDVIRRDDVTEGSSLEAAGLRVVA